jgi:Uma2 family endonuclease
MSTASHEVPRFTPEQYLALERSAERKSEFHNGFIEAMAGASLEHNQIVVNLVRELSNRLLDGPCNVLASDMRVWIESARRYVYPDVLVVCGEPRFQDREFDTLLNPTVIVEVLSPSTERKDRGKKFVAYRTMDSLREYVLVDSESVLVEVFSRRDDQWVLTAARDRQAAVRLQAIDCELPLERIYARVEVAKPGSEGADA